MVPLVLLIHPDPPWSTFSVKFEKVSIRADQSGPGGPREPQPPLVDQERSGPPWTTVRHFPDAVDRKSAWNTFISIGEIIALDIKKYSCLSLEWLPMSSMLKYSLLLEFACRKHIIGWASVTVIVRFGDMSVLPKPLSARSVNSN